MKDHSLDWFRKLRQAAKEWAKAYDLSASPIHPMSDIRSAFVRDLRERHPELVNHYSAKAWVTHENVIAGDLWYRVRGDVESIFKAARYVRAPAALRVNARLPGVKDVLIRLPDETDDDFYRELAIEHLELMRDRRIKLKENIGKAVDEIEALLDTARESLPDERRRNREWLPKTYVT